MSKYYKDEDIVKMLVDITSQPANWARQELSCIPVADVDHIRHGHWDCYCCSRFLGMKDGEPRWADGKYYYCSLCRRRTVIRENYCPECGAKMDEKVDQ